MQRTISFSRLVGRVLTAAAPAPLLACFVVLVIAGLSLGAKAQSAAQSTAFEKLSRTATKTEAAVAGSETAADIDVAALTDAQVRRLLLQRLAEDDANAQPTEQAGGGESMFVRLLSGVQSGSVTLSVRTQALAQAVSRTAEEWKIVLRNLTDDQGLGEVFKALLILCVMLVGGFLAERQVRKSSTPWFNSFSAKYYLETGRWLRRFQTALIRLLLELVLIAAFTLVAYLLSFVFFDRFQPLRIFVTTYLLVIASVRVVAALSRFFVAPRKTELRLLPINDEQAAYVHRWVIIIAGFAAFGLFSCGLLKLLGVSEDLHLFLNLMVGTGIALLSFVTLAVRKRDWRVDANGDGSADHPISSAWFGLTLILIAIVWGVWVVNLLLGRPDLASSAVNSLLLLAVLPVVDFVVKGFLGWLFGLQKHSDAELIENARYAAVFQNVVRVLLFGVAFYVLANAMGFGLLDVASGGRGAMVFNAGFNITVTVLLAYVVWEMVKILTAKHSIEDGSADDMMAMDGEGGEAAPATRLETLMPLLRSVILVTLVIIVVMIALSSIGVNIGPLIAGAGVIGLAIGFGAQKLVQDVISGIFFLLDDAFRVGEYIEAAEMTGTVENITIRSMRLRHHLGPVQTVPYSEVSTIKNHSRDYIIMKLKFRVPYNTDIEKVRKTIKKVGQELLQHEEMGPSFIAPLKSQGVLEMDDSAMVMRMKFTARPGEQWVLRREAYRRVRDALTKDGIEFAHRQVTVHVPNNNNDPKIAGAAAAAAIEQQELDEQKAAGKRGSGDVR